MKQSRPFSLSHLGSLMMVGRGCQRWHRWLLSLWFVQLWQWIHAGSHVVCQNASCQCRDFHSPLSAVSAVVYCLWLKHSPFSGADADSWTSVKAGSVVGYTNNTGYYSCSSACK